MANVKSCSSYVMLSAVMLTVIILGVFAKCHFAKRFNVIGRSCATWF
jgi:hypothetical protein